jgi:CelD/BcsL family acetyltransferase involved in cellulose biosynthesis
MNIIVIPARALRADQVDTWSALQQASPDLSSPFLSPEFTVAVAAARPDVCVGILEQNGRPVGFFPYQHSRFAIGHPVGGLLNDVQGVIAAPSVEWGATELVRGCGLAAWRFTRARGSQTAWQPFHYARRFSAVVDLSHGWSAYADIMRTAVGAQALDRKSRKLEREDGPLRFEAHSDDPALLDKLMHWKLGRYGPHGYLDAFAIPWVRELFERIHATQTAGFAGMLSVLYAGDEPVAANMGLRSRDTWHYWCPAYDRRFWRCSPGLLLLQRIIEHAAEAGMREVELGGCDEYPYKRLFMNDSRVLLEGTVGAVPVIATVDRWRHSSENWVRHSRLLRPPARRLLRAYRRARHGLLYGGAAGDVSPNDDERPAPD